jgi:hypothetical protein
LKESRSQSKGSSRAQNTSGGRGNRSAQRIDEKSRLDALTGVTGWYRLCRMPKNDQYQTPCWPVSIAITSASKQIPENNTTGSTVLAAFSDLAVNADDGAKK